MLVVRNQSLQGSDTDPVPGLASVRGRAPAHNLDCDTCCPLVAPLRSPRCALGAQTWQLPEIFRCVTSPSVYILPTKRVPLVEY